MKDKIKAALFGLAIGDALGVPVEFKSRDYLKSFPVNSMIGFGSWHQPAGTWSDDSSLAFCLAESLTKGYNPDDIATNFINWYQHGYWGAHHKVFDIGGATRFAIERLMKGCSPTLSGGIMEEDNGNGSLMRILPLLFVIGDLPIEERYAKVKEVSSITHAHFRSVFACFIYIETALLLLKGNSINVAIQQAAAMIEQFAEQKNFNRTEIGLFNPVLKNEIKHLKESAVPSGGYVLDSLKASLWCLLNTDNYADAILKAVNLGGDTDTTACVTGGLAGLIYGYETIPKIWINELARKNDIDDLCERLFKSIDK